MCESIDAHGAVQISRDLGCAGSNEPSAAAALPDLAGRQKNVSTSTIRPGAGNYPVRERALDCFCFVLSSSSVWQWQWQRRRRPAPIPVDVVRSLHRVELRRRCRGPRTAAASRGRAVGYSRRIRARAVGLRSGSSHRQRGRQNRKAHAGPLPVRGAGKPGKPAGRTTGGGGGGMGTNERRTTDDGRRMVGDEGIVVATHALARVRVRSRVRSPFWMERVKGKG
ncbi:hypothetical protein EDC01DRAFT_675017 [Geopyxis carbonaria]|nr:hypothetical protein EDC01DRAFT_675017 [Geopyxis carbonaria]